MRPLATLCTFLITGLLHANPPEPRWQHSTEGQIRVEPAPVPAELRNLWPEEWEREFQQRASQAIVAQTTNGKYGGTYFENEKRAYGKAMLSILGGYPEAGLKFLQEEDADAKRWHQHTLGIDLFPNFTLKHQARKYFYFGPWLRPEYRDRMKEAARLWTEHDPLGRPHPAFKGRSKQENWTPEAQNSWVDPRGTDNLKLMRDTSAYLFAEEAGNEATRQIYKKRLAEFVGALYCVGNGEWDSENYLGHGIAPLLNLYDFAKDTEVRRIAKAGLDWLTCTGALKYWRGNFCGPNRRDYNHPYPFGGSAAMSLWMWFGDTPSAPPEWESDEIHQVTSSYRPPAAAVALARKQFPRPVEMFNLHGPWEAWKKAETAQPEFRETMYFGRHFQFGTLAQGTCLPDVNGFKILVADKKQGAAQIVAAPCSDPRLLGSPKYVSGVLAGPSAVGQNGNLAVYLTAEAAQPFLWIVPENARVETREGVTLVYTEKCTLAIWPINTAPALSDPELTAQLHEKKDHANVNQVLRSTRADAGFYGFAVEISEGESAEEFAKKAVKQRPDLSGLSKGIAAMRGVEGREVRVAWSQTPDEIQIWRDGKLRDLQAPEEQMAFGGGTSLISQQWRGGTLRVDTGEHRFECTVHKDGRVEWNRE